MGFIYGSSNHPVQIKKVSLKAWGLSDELQATIAERLEQIPEKEWDSMDISQLPHLLTKDLRPIYAPTQLQLIQGGAQTKAAPAGQPEAEEDEFSAMMAEAAKNPDAVVDINPEAVAAAEKPQVEVAPEGNNEAKTDDKTAAAPVTLAALEKPKDHEPSLSNELELSFPKPEMSNEIVADGVSLLSDINMQDICFFSTRPFVAGQTVVIDLLVNKPLMLTAEILSCKNYNLYSRVISQNRPTHRIHAKFIFLREGERTILRNFVQSIEPNIPLEKSKGSKAKKESKEGDDGLDDLGL